MTLAAVLLTHPGSLLSQNTKLEGEILELAVKEQCFLNAKSFMFV